MNNLLTNYSEAHMEYAITYLIVNGFIYLTVSALLQSSCFCLTGKINEQYLV